MRQFDDDHNHAHPHLDTIQLSSRKSSLDLSHPHRQAHQHIDSLLTTSSSRKSSVIGDPSDVLQLNVGGKTDIAVLRRTLTMMEGSMLARRFGGKYDDILEKDRDGNIFVDQPPELFLQMIHYLRCKACETPRSSRTEPPPATDDFVRMVEYYGMSLCVYPVDVAILWGTANIVQSYRVHAAHFATFDLERVRHERCINAYEVILGRFKAAQIGWRLARDPKSHETSLKSMFLKGLNGGLGVGEISGSVSLDCLRTGILQEGIFFTVDTISIQEGSVIRCERHQNGYRWIVDGREVNCQAHEMNTSISVPCISITGNLRLSSISYSEE